MKASRTINRLHFDDLSPDRFEDLCLSVIYRLQHWIEINHFGRTGSDDGIDIHAVDELENGKIRTWDIQCKRYSSISKTQLCQIVDKILAKRTNIPSVLLVIVSCDVTKKSIEAFKSYSLSKGIQNPIIWTASIIEAELYSRNHDLLFAYFGINLMKNRNERIETVRRKVQLKHKMENDFRAQVDLRAKREIGDTIRFNNFIIRSIDDTKYPDNDLNNLGISPWFKVEPHSFYHNGISVIIGVTYIGINEDKTWDTIENLEEERKQYYTTCRAFTVGRIPYDNIITYDIDGDEYYNFPHIYCDFANNGSPYEEIVYYWIAKEEEINLYNYFDNQKRIRNINRRTTVST